MYTGTWAACPRLVDVTMSSKYYFVTDYSKSKGAM